MSSKEFTQEEIAAVNGFENIEEILEPEVESTAVNQNDQGIAVDKDGGLNIGTSKYGPGYSNAGEGRDQLEVEVFAGDHSRARKRKKKAKPQEWIRQANFKKRMHGKEYSGFVRKKNERTPTTEPPQRPAKVLGPRCVSTKCEKCPVLKCGQISEQNRQEMFKNFWETMDWGQKKVYVCTLVDAIETKQKTTDEKSRRDRTLVYHLNNEGKRTRVCQQMFLSTFDIGEYQVQTWTKRSVFGIPSPVPVNLGVTKICAAADFKKGHKAKRLSAADFLNNIPKMPSHYCRKDTTKMYLEPTFNSGSHLYSVYKKYCTETNLDFVSRFTFDQLFKEMNLSIFTPKKDQCDTCCAFKAKNISEDDWNAHVLKKDRARAEKTADKESALKHECVVLSMDLEAVKLAPSLKASALYFKTKLCVHNFTIYNLGDHSATCYWWNESEGGLEASIFATCLLDFLTETCQDDIPIIIYSDGCTYQNRNAIMSNALVHWSSKENKTIVQKFLEKGHTQMECDSVHSAIEAKLKNKDIYLPGDYPKICLEARTKPFEYNVKYLSYDFFKNYSVPDLTRYSSIRPGKSTGDDVVTDLRCLKYDSGEISFKIDFDHEWQPLPHKPKNVKPETFPQLYLNRLSIPDRKWKDLQDLKMVLPAHCHGYYDELPH